MTARGLLSWCVSRYHAVTGGQFAPVRPNVDLVGQISLCPRKQYDPCTIHCVVAQLKRIIDAVITTDR